MNGAYWILDVEISKGTGNGYRMADTGNTIIYAMRSTGC
jgi:hypothetical protein